MNDAVKQLFHRKQINSSSIEEMCEAIVSKYNIQEEVNKRLIKENADLRTEIWKDEALKDMKEEYERMKDEYYRGFPISKNEMASILEWQRKHDAEEHKNPRSYHGAIGGAYSYTFVPTSIGTSGVCYCDICKAKAMEEAACYNGHFDKGIYSQYLTEHNGSFEFQEIG